MPKYYYHWSSPNTQTIEEARTHKLLSYIYVDQVTNVPCSFFPQSAVDDNGYVPLVDAKDRLHHKHDPKTPRRMSERSPKHNGIKPGFFYGFHTYTRALCTSNLFEPYHFLQTYEVYWKRICFILCYFKKLRILTQLLLKRRNNF